MSVVIIWVECDFRARAKGVLKLCGPTVWNEDEKNTYEVYLGSFTYLRWSFSPDIVLVEAGKGCRSYEEMQSWRRYYGQRCHRLNRPGMVCMVFLLTSAYHIPESVPHPSKYARHCAKATSVCLLCLSNHRRIHMIMISGIYAV